MSVVEGVSKAQQTVVDETTITDSDSLVFCSLPPRQSVSNWESEPHRMSYYNANEQLAVPFKWEAAPGKPMVDPSQQVQDRSSQSARLRPPPAAATYTAAGRSSRMVSRTTSGEALNARAEVFDRLSSGSTLCPATTSLRMQFSATAATQQQRSSRLPPKDRSLSSLPQYATSLSTSTTTSAAGYGNQGNSNVHRPGHASNESSCRRSDFDWPEVSDDESGSTPRDYDRETATATASSVNKDDSCSPSSFSSASSSSPSSTGTAGSGGGSARDIVLWRNLVVAAASAATPSRPVCGGGGSNASFSEDDEEDDDDEADHVRPGRRFLSCMPIFSRVLGKSQRNVPAMIDFSNRLTPGLKNKFCRY